MSGRMMRPGRPTRPADAHRAAGVQQPPIQQASAAGRPAEGRPAPIDDRLSVFFGEDQIPEASIPAMPMPAVGLEQPVYDAPRPQAPRAHPQAPVQQWPQAQPVGRSQRPSKRQSLPQAQNLASTMLQQGLRPQDQQINNLEQAASSPAQSSPDQPMRPPASNRQQTAANPALMDDPQYREFLAWKQAQQEAAQPTPAPVTPSPTPALQPPVAPSAPRRAPSNAATSNATDRPGRRTSRAEARATAPAATVPEQAAGQKIESEDGEFTPFHYPGYNGPGYPKGLGHGPVVTRKNIKTGKIIKVEGMAWEEFPESWRQMLDEKPYDDAGALRIFLKATSGIEAKYPFYEIGSAAHAGKFLDEMRSKRSMLHNGVDLSYGSRPQQDAALWK